MPWWAWLGLGVLFGLLIGGVVLDTLTYYRLFDDVCKIAVTQHVVVAGCRG